jgi:XTP/dITP diphosphohydrolase
MNESNKLTLLFATHNPNKVEEMRSILGNKHHILSLTDAGISQSLEEPFDTLEDNARAKCSAVYQLTGTSCFSEDTGLFTKALGGRPGVHSARYAGEKANADDNIKKLLEELSGHRNREAEFRTIICLVFGGREYFFEGICPGAILENPRGRNGFGYDPVFIPEGSDKTFAEMTLPEKSVFSHRKKALAKLIGFLENNV